jgi:hypothetical protein
VACRVAIDILAVELYRADRKHLRGVRAVADHVMYPADHAIDTAMRSSARAKLPKTVVCSMKNPSPPDGGQRHEYRLFCRAEKVRRLTADGWDYFACGECSRHAERRIMLDPEMKTELSYPVRYVIEMHRGELEDR